MEWLNVTAEQGLGGLLLASFLAATVLPGGSEPLFWLFLHQHPAQLWPALVLATLGNTAGGMTSWACGRLLPPARIGPLARHIAQVRRWGAPTLTLAWLPLVGDALCVAAGWLRLHWLPCLCCMAVGKGLRYWMLAQTV